MGKCSVREFTFYKSFKLKIISNSTEQEYLKEVVLFKPDWDGSKFQDISDGWTEKSLPSREGMKPSAYIKMYKKHILIFYNNF